MKRNESDFVKTSKTLEKEYDNLMLEQHILKKHGYSLFEMEIMPAQDRKWIINQIAKDVEEEKRAYERGGSSHTPGVRP